MPPLVRAFFPGLIQKKNIEKKNIDTHSFRRRAVADIITDVLLDHIFFSKARYDARTEVLKC
jgi:hypothetical protein